MADKCSCLLIGGPSHGKRFLLEEYPTIIRVPRDVGRTDSYAQRVVENATGKEATVYCWTVMSDKALLELIGQLEPKEMAHELHEPINLCAND